MTTELVTAPQMPGSLELVERDREAARAVASGLRDAKAQNTHQAYAWRNFQAWADGRGHQALPAAPQTVALYWATLPPTARPSLPSRRPAPRSPTSTPPTAWRKAATRPWPNH